MCASAPECRRLAIEAVERQDFETAHTLAWRAMQAVPKNDPASMRVLARAQSLSGRPHDALIMLQRLAQAGVRVEEAATSDDYRRVRELSGWPALLAAIDGAPPPIIAATEGATTPASSSAATATPTAPPDDGLPVPSSLHSVMAIAYDGVSRRFVIADDSTDTLKIVDQTSGKAMNLVSSGWAGGHSVTALAIDTRRGDLWAATPDALHRMQLVSGRRLQTLAAPVAEPPVNFVALKAGPNGVFALDATGARIYTASAGDKTLQLHATLDKITNPSSLAIADDASLYVAHAGGILRLHAATRKGAPLKAAAGITLAPLRSIEWMNGALIATGGVEGGLTIRKMQLDPTRARVTAVAQLGPVASAATTVSGRRVYHLVETSSGAVIVGRTP
jgi:hypothetical protein